MGARQQQERASAHVLTLPGLGPILRDEMRVRGLTPGRSATDRRADIVAVSGSWTALAQLRVAEDVLADVAVVPLRQSVTATAGQIGRDFIAGRVRSLRAEGLLAPTSSLRVVVRLQDERRFRRTALRGAIEQTLRLDAHPRPDDATELWVVQTGTALVVGVRLPGFGSRGRPPRRAERPGSLRPAVAAAMVRLVGAPGNVLDPCCGSGTILAEAGHAGCTVIGGDIDAPALGVANANVRAHLLLLDARRLPFIDGAFDAVVSNLPFGHQHVVQGTPVAWYRRVITEACRVAPHVVLLAPPTLPFRQALGRLPIQLDRRVDVNLLGQRAAIWVLRSGTS